jgi:hypothetical protein
MFSMQVALRRYVPVFAMMLSALAEGVIDRASWPCRNQEHLQPMVERAPSMGLQNFPPA